MTDFGIATTDDGQPGGGGMSIPWSPPEAFGSPPEASAASDTFSLAATLYTLLAGRSPFELPGHSNSSLDLTRRRRSGDVTPLTRSDVPDSLRQLFEIALDPSQSADTRPRSHSGTPCSASRPNCRLPVTTIDVFEEVDSEHRADDDDGATRVHGVIGSYRMRRALHRRRTRWSSGAVTGQRPAAVSTRPAGRTRASAAESAAASGAPGAAAAVVLLVVGAVLLTMENTMTTSTRRPRHRSRRVGSAAFPPAPIAVEATAEGDQATFTWVNPQPQAGDCRVRVDTDLGQEAPVVVTEPQITVDLREEGRHLRHGDAGARAEDRVDSDRDR